MKELFKNIRNDRTTNFGFLSTLILTIVTLIFIVFSYRNLPPFIPIFNQLPWGEQRLGDTLSIFIPILVSILIFVLNIIMAVLVYAKIPLLSRILAATSLLITILSFLFIVKTIFLIS